MAARTRKTKVNGNGNANGMSTKQMRRKKPINTDHLTTITPLTEGQRKVFECWEDNKNLVLHGAAGTGKTFISLYIALREVLNPNTP